MVYHVKQNADGSQSTVESNSGLTASKLGTPDEGAVQYSGDAGTKAIGVLRVAANVADEETVTIGADVYEFDRAADGVTAGRIAVTGHAGDTPGAATDALISTINASGTEDVTAIDISANEVLIVANSVGDTTTALAETMAGSNNAWDSAAMAGGALPTLRREVLTSRVPTTQEVALGNLHIALPFTPSYVSVLVTVTASGIPKAWDGVATIESGRVELDNSGSTDWAATDTVTVLAKI